MALFSVHFTRFAPDSIDPLHSLAGLSGLHWFGTDENGRDVLSRTLAGVTTVLVIAPLSTLLALLLGGTIGMVSGYVKGTTDEVIMRFVDVLLAMPVIVAAIVVVSALGHSVPVIILVIGVLFTPPVARTIRAAVQAEVEKEYVKAARLRGESAPYIMAFEILPEHPRADHRRGHRQARLCGLHRRHPVVPGLRHPAAVPRLGIDDLDRPSVHPGRLVDSAVPGARPGLARRGRQPAGRRPAQGTLGVTA